MEEISDEAGKLAKDPEFTFWYPKNKEEVVGKLNGGLYHQLLQHFQGKKWDHGVSNGCCSALTANGNLTATVANSYHIGGLHDCLEHEARRYNSRRRSRSRTSNT